MSSSDPNKSELESTIYHSVEDDARPFDVSVERGPSSSVNLSARMFTSISRTLIPTFIRHNAYRLSHKVQQAIRYESETGTKFLMLPIAFAIGALVYFSLPREPLLLAVLIATTISLFIANKTYGSWSGNLALVAAFIFAGATAGKLRTDIVDTVMISKPAQVRLSGIVLNREERANGRQRYTIAVREFEGRSGPVPEKVRITAHAKYGLVNIGQGIIGLARLRPPSGPAYPGGYDFAFQSWYKGISANGFFLGAPDVDGTIAVSSLTMRISVVIASVRFAIGQRIREALPGESGSLAAALIVGDRSGISDETVEALRRSGLAHILAISGLHMALVTATIILLVRGTLAMIPSIALYYPIRKWAALAALMVASIYLVISGAGIATQRAWIMIVIMLLAILSDRRALTMRNVGLAALVVLAWRPESIVSPSFQMSFAAVAALVAVYESWSRYRRNRPYRPSTNKLMGLVSNLFKSLSGLAVTSIVAGVATGLFAAYHFHRVAPFGLLANLAAMPLVSVAVMPMALAAMILMPFGLESYPLELMGWAIDQVVFVAGWVTGLGTLGNTGFLPLSSLLLGTMALVIATQLKSVLRYVSVLFLGLAAVSFTNGTPPDILISESGSSVGIIDNSGQLQLLNPRKEKFITNIWRKSYAPWEIEASFPKTVIKNNGQKKAVFNCDELGCTTLVAGNLLLSMIKRPQAFLEDCERADIIVTKFEVPDWCTKPQLIIDHKMLRSRGSHAISVQPKSARTDNLAFVVSAAMQQFKRPWSRHR